MPTATGTTCRGKAIFGRPMVRRARDLTHTAMETGCTRPDMDTCGSPVIHGAICRTNAALELLQRLWLGLGAGDGRLHAVVGIGILWRPQHRLCALRLSPSPTPDSPARGANSPQTDSDDRGEPARVVGHFRAAGARQEYARDDCGEYRSGASPAGFAPGIRAHGSSREIGACKRQADRREVLQAAARRATRTAPPRTAATVVAGSHSSGGVAAAVAATAAVVVATTEAAFCSLDQMFDPLAGEIAL